MSPYIFLYLFLYFILFIQTKNYRNKPQYTIILLMYSIAAIFACYMCYNAKPYNSHDYFLGAIVYHCIALYLWIKPTEQLCIFNNTPLRYASPNVIKLLTYLVIICSIPALIYKFANLNLSMIMSDVIDYRSAIYDQSNNEASLIGYLSAFANSYWSIAIALAFYYIVHYPQKKIQITLLFISSLYIIVYGMSNAGREYFVKYIFVLVLMYITLKNKFSYAVNTKLKRIGFILIGFFVTVFFIITIERFGYSRSDNYDSVSNSLIYYLGQGYCNFSQCYEAFGHGQWNGAMIFPFFTGTTIQHHNLQELVNVDFRMNTFSTSIGSLVSDVGSILALILILLFAAFIRYVSRRKLDIFTLIYMSWIYDYMFSGLFFFHDHFSRFRVISILFIIILDVVNRQYTLNRLNPNKLKTNSLIN